MPRIATIIDNKQVRGSQRKANPAPKIDKRHATDDDQWIDGDKWVKVRSSHVAAIKYERGASQKLWVRFKNGHEGYYPGVTVRQAKVFFHEVSMGKAVWKYRRAGRAWVRANY
jgi:hypothetical protein